MNGTERRYAELLEGRKRAGEVLWWMYEGISFRLADLRCHYHPDFAVMLADETIEIHETKGAFAREDSLIKLKVAAALFPFVFRKCVWDKGKWSIEIVGASKSKPDPSPAKKHVPITPRYIGGPIPSGMAVVNGFLIPASDALAMIPK
jgi:hypothetical protein